MTLYAGTDSHDNKVTQAGATVNGLEKIFCHRQINFQGQMPVGKAQPDREPLEKNDVAQASRLCPLPAQNRPYMPAQIPMIIE
ncbi:MAG: hypothetical protein KME26_06990 [Oscillatoria princeps RMCB-10]|jgi:hypothetical protein|nr:hypothetical protein [Oscillatoria princeps RMCB-10]